MQALPILSLGLGVFQTVQAQQTANRALEEARKPRLSPEQQATIRREGTSNIGAALASRGLLDSSLYTGGLANLERGIGEATAGAGTAGDVSSLLWQQALGQGQSGSGAIGNIAQLYMLNRLFGGSGSPFGNLFGGAGGGPPAAAMTTPSINPWLYSLPVQ